MAGEMEVGVKVFSASEVTSLLTCDPRRERAFDFMHLAQLGVRKRRDAVLRHENVQLVLRVNPRGFCASLNQSRACGLDFQWWDRDYGYNNGGSNGYGTEYQSELRKQQLLRRHQPIQGRRVATADITRPVLPSIP